MYFFQTEDELNPKSKKRQPHLAKFSDDECIHQRNNIMNQDLIHGTISVVAAKAFTIVTSENKAKSWLFQPICSLLLDIGKSHNGTLWLLICVRRIENATHILVIPVVLNGGLFSKRFSSCVYIFCAILNNVARVIHVICANGRGTQRQFSEKYLFGRLFEI